jgi:hypothetical protein
MVTQGGSACETSPRGEGLTLCTATGARFFGPIFLGLGAEAHAAAGQPDRALGAIETGLRLVERNGERFWEPELYPAKGDLLLAMKDAAEGDAKSLFQRALAMAWEQGGSCPSSALPPALPASGRPRAGATKPASCFSRSTTGSPKASTRGI